MILYFKAVSDDPIRRQDEQDFHTLLPILDQEERDWLRESLATAHPHHPWLRHLPT
ncbi:hypothetical protein ACFQ1L_11930 [Phytohabitans flavus]|uniref:hypothetical protein n=1 Tax=Phytohabitans flavus TaxID=1076124 RepID=UPI003627513C